MLPRAISRRTDGGGIVLTSAGPFAADTGADAETRGRDTRVFTSAFGPLMVPPVLLELNGPLANQPGFHRAGRPGELGEVSDYLTRRGRLRPPPLFSCTPRTSYARPHAGRRLHTGRNAPDRVLLHTALVMKMRGNGALGRRPAVPLPVRIASPAGRLSSAWILRSGAPGRRVRNCRPPRSAPRCPMTARATTARRWTCPRWFSLRCNRCGPRYPTLPDLHYFPRRPAIAIVHGPRVRGARCRPESSYCENAVRCGRVQALLMALPAWTTPGPSRVGTRLRDRAAHGTGADRRDGSATSQCEPGGSDAAPGPPSSSTTYQPGQGIAMHAGRECFGPALCRPESSYCENALSQRVGPAPRWTPPGLERRPPVGTRCATASAHVLTAPKPAG